MSQEVYSVVYQSEQSRQLWVEELLQEDKEVAAQRMNCKAMLDVLKKASAILNQVSDNEL